ncbi:hypothetical protein [Streptomyces sp. H27-D2]|uniref:hypothetical protein n=1 Tax=Streptomyces sp. H27-D2 TaxID=3046304 RepID=UPI002DBF4268|nr:hypothetical protein [Streptomyces sp. H27-D2]MEC4016023.1 hypothetical protein [Streptomyces sp. H27-D2]
MTALDCTVPPVVDGYGPSSHRSETAISITPDEARERADATLRSLYATVADWDRSLIEQAIEAIGDDGRTFSMNGIRDLLPDMAHRTAGLVMRSLIGRKNPTMLVKIGEEPSTSGPTHGKRINIYRLARTVSQRAAA